MKKLSLLFYITIALQFSCCNMFCNVKNSNQNPSLVNLNNGGYEEAWKTIDSLDQQRLPKSALEQVEALYKRAQKDNNPSQVIKTVLYREKYTSQLEEDGYTKSVYRLEQEIESSALPVKPILQSMLGQIYSSYLDRNHWKIQNQTETVDFSQQDIRTWSVGKLIDESNRLFKASLQYDDLDKVPIQQFNAITTEARNSDQLRPTLFDFLAHRAVDHFMNERSYLTEPATVFNILDKEAFADVQTFANHKFITQDSSSNKYNTLLLLQKLLQQKLNLNDPAPLVDADLKRLKFVKNNAVHPDKDALYFQALKNLEANHQNTEANAEINFYIADYYYNKGTGYQGEEKDERKWDWKKANDICEAAIRKFPKSYGASLCLGLQNSIHSKALNIRSEMVNIPEQPVLCQLSYKNVSTVHFKLIKIPATDWTSFHRKRQDEILSYFQTRTPEKTWSHNLPEDGDFRDHRVELSLDPLGFGIYALVASHDNSFQRKGNGLSYLIFHSSNIAFQNQQTDSGQRFLITDRTTGAPLKDATVDFYERKYNPRNRKDEYIKLKSATTNQDGIVTASFGNKHFQLEITRGDDQLTLRENFSSYRYNRNKNEQSFTHFFTDRAIYRPGQNIHFKALLLENDDKSIPSIQANKNITITLMDVNGQEVEKLNLRSNEYGTVNGIFKAPKGLLTGRMTIRSDFGNAYHSIQVEEYKRPKFEVAFNPVEGSYRLGDEVTTTGYARALAGNNIDGAKVQYRVVREARFPYFPWWFRGFGRGIQPSNSMEITNGTTTTDEKGAFEIKFDAVPDLSIDKTKKPEFIYRVYADVTDINGETRSGDARVKAGYVAIDISVDVPAEIHADSIRQVEISSKNLNGNFEAATGSLKIEALKTPATIYHKRYWEFPDKTLISEADFKRQFPLLPFRDEDKPEKWPVAKTVYDQSFNTADNKIQTITQNLLPGKYLLTLKSQDKYGEAVELKKIFTVFDYNSNNVPSNEALFCKLEKQTCEPGEQAVIHIAAAEKNMQAFYEIEHDGKIVSSKWINVGDMQKLTIPVEEKHRGNLHYHINIVHHNRKIGINETIFVPWSNKELTVEYASFRDKLSPGQKEEWQIKIKGPKSSTVAAEMLASMYDASLDFFVPHNWNLSPYPHSRAKANFWSRNFIAANGQQTGQDWQPYQQSNVYRSYRNMNWFGFSLGGGYTQFLAKSRRGMEMEMAAPMSAEPQMDMKMANGAAADGDEDGMAPPPLLQLWMKLMMAMPLLK